MTTCCTGLPDSVELPPLWHNAREKPHPGVAAPSRIRSRTASHLRLDPVRTLPHVDHEWHREFRRVLHLVADEFPNIFQLGSRYLEHQFVVNLQQHPRLEPTLRQGALDIDHRDLDQVRRRSLDR